MPLRVSSLCSSITPSATLRLNALVVSMRASGADVINLAAGEPDGDTPGHIRQAAHIAIDSGKTKYTAAAGIPELRRALAQRLSQGGLPYAAGQVIVGTGAKQVLLGALLALLEPGDEVLLPSPCWLSYPDMVRMAGGRPILVPADLEQGYVPTLSQLEAAVTSRTRAIIINSPNNPTGAVWSAEQMAYVCDVARRHGLAIISDEIYEALTYFGARHISPASLGADALERTITVSGLSKSYAMTGWRIGYAAGPKHIIDAMDAYQSHATGNASSVSQYAALEAIQGDQRAVEEMRSVFEHRLTRFADMLKGVPGITFQMPRGAFYVLLNVSALMGARLGDRVAADDGMLAELLLEEALVSTVPGGPFGAPGCLRLSFATDEVSLARAAGRIGDLFDRLKPYPQLAGA